MLAGGSDGTATTIARGTVREPADAIRRSGSAGREANAGPADPREPAGHGRTQERHAREEGPLLA
jgi:hypothetical protein